MKQLVAFLITFSYFIQLFSPIIVLAEEATQPLVEDAQLVVQESTPSPQPSEQEDEPRSEAPGQSLSQPESSPTLLDNASTPTPTPTLSPSPSPSPFPTPTVESEVFLSALTTATDSAEISEPNDVADATPSASLLITGDSLATADITSVSNVSLQDSCLKIQSVQLEDGDSGDFSDPACVDTPEAANEATLDAQLSNDPPEFEPEAAEASNPAAQQNTGTDTTNLAVVANSGSNEVTSAGDAALLTGDAIALAQLQQLMNLNFVDSSLWLLFITLLPSFNGDIILPTPEMIARQSAGYDSLNGTPNLNNQAQLQNSVDSTANTGLNQMSGQSTYGETGDVFAAANVFALANSEVSDALWYILWLNVAGQWGGYVYSWQSGSSVLKYDPYQTAVLAGSGQTQTPDSGSNCQSNDCGASEVSNGAVVQNTVSVLANTGNNSLHASGSAAMQTGKAISLVNLVTLLNSRITNSRIFLGFLNILGDWQGSVLMARPELSVALHSEKTAVTLGDQLAYTIQYRNQGHDQANAVSLAFQIPSGAQYLSSSLAPSEKMENGVVIWDLGQLTKGQSGSITVFVKVHDWSTLQAQQWPASSWWGRLVPIVQAAEESRHFTVFTAISTVDEQSSTQANQASLTTTVYSLSVDSGEDDKNPASDPQERMIFQASSDSNNADQSSAEPLLWPLELEVSNNVNNFIYPGDTVQFWVKVKNMGDAPLHNATITHQLTDGEGELLTMVFPLGNLPAHKEGRLSFGLTVPPMTLTQPLQLYSKTAFRGQLDNGQRVYSNQRETSFVVQPKLFNFSWQPISVPIVPTAQADEGQVLGVATTRSTPTNQPPAWILFLSLLLAFLSVRTLRYQIFRNARKESAE